MAELQQIRKELYRLFNDQLQSEFPDFDANLGVYASMSGQRAVGISIEANVDKIEIGLDFFDFRYGPHPTLTVKGHQRELQIDLSRPDSFQETIDAVRNWLRGR